MGYTFQGFIGAPEVLEAASLCLRQAKIVTLTGTLAAIPLGDELQDEIDADEGRLSERWDILTDRIEAVGAKLSEHGRVAYVEADYFGGTGDQGCVVWEHGRELLRETRTEQAINHALRLLGVQTAEGAADEFDTVGMGKYRRVENWLDE